MKLYTGEGSPIISVGFRGTLNGNATSFSLYDDGLHNDSLAGDKIYGNTIIIGDYYDFLKGKFLWLHCMILFQLPKCCLCLLFPLLSKQKC
ncbi:MAG: hypothetical protein IPJ75_11125 [Ignavibacteriales bacterium]|nr:hypothetical protein [Ignavibacteriales bacterium]